MVRRADRVVLLVLLTEEVAGGVNVTQNRSQIGQVVTATQIQTGDWHGHAVVPEEISYRHGGLHVGAWRRKGQGHIGL